MFSSSWVVQIVLVLWTLCLLRLYFICLAQILVQILVSHPPRETGCDPALTVQLCCLIILQLFPTFMQHHELKLGSNKANSTVESYQHDNFRVP